MSMATLFWMDGKISRMNRDQAVKPRTPSASPGESRRNTKINSIAVIRWLALSTKLNGQCPPTAKQIQKAMQPSTAQAEAPTQFGIPPLAIPQKNPAAKEQAPSMGNTQNKKPPGATPRKTPSY